MKKWLRKAIISVSSAILCSVQAVSSMPYYGSAASTQMYTWRMVEKLNANEIYGYNSEAKNKNNYEYGGCISGKLDASLMIDYTDNTLACLWFSANPIDFSKNRYLSSSTWYVPFSTTKFSLDYDYDVVSDEDNATIKPLYVLVGDVNQDNQITSADSQIIAECLLPNSNKESTLTENQKIAADVNNKDGIDLQDAIAIEKFLKGSIDRFPSGK